MAGIILRKTGVVLLTIEMDITGGACGIEAGAWDS